jgi:site-specific recombinase XerD
MKKNPAHVWLSSLNSNISVKNYTIILNRLCKTINKTSINTFQWSDIDYVMVLNLKRLLLDESISHSSINTYLSAIKGVSREAWQLDLISVDCYMKIREIKRLKGNSNTKGRSLAPNEMNNLVFSKCRGGDAMELRDTAIIALTYAAGLRRGEVVKLDVSDYKNEKITVHGKGSKIRMLHLPQFSIKILNRWLHIRGDWDGAIFPAFRRGNHIVEQTRLSTNSIEDILKKRGKKLKLEHFSPQDLRRSFATNLLDAGIDAYIVRRLMRHEKIETTIRYDMNQDRDAKKSVELLPI